MPSIPDLNEYCSLGAMKWNRFEESSNRISLDCWDLAGLLLLELLSRFCFLLFRLLWSFEGELVRLLFLRSKSVSSF